MLPRTRGDGPISCGACTGALGASPHPRGWTLPIEATMRVEAGFPAPAGMDLYSYSLLT